MEKSRCSEDNFDAIYLCSSCRKMLCPKHYFSHQENCPEDKIGRIKIPVNNESRQILINYLIKYKKILISAKDKDLEIIGKVKGGHEYLLTENNEAITTINLFLLFATKAQYIPTKMIYTPFEYFLHQPAYKTNNFISCLKESERFMTRSHKYDLMFFNYFIFEDKKYIFGLNYMEAYDKIELKILCYTIILGLCWSSEYEIAYEILHNFKDILKVSNIELSIFICCYAELLYNVIKKTNVLELLEIWNFLEANIPKHFKKCFYEMSFYLFKALNLNELALYCSEKFGKRIDLILNVAVANIHYENFEEAAKFGKNVIQMIKSNSKYRDSKFGIMARIILNIIYNKQKKIKIEKYLKFFKDNELYEFILPLYIAWGNFDAAEIYAWNLIKMHKKNRAKLSYNESFIYIYLGISYLAKGNLKKAHQALYNAKSYIGAMWMNSQWAYLIYYFLGIVCLKNRLYKDALYNFELIINSGYSITPYASGLFKIYIGITNYYMQNYNKALKNLVELEQAQSFLRLASSYLLFILYALMGLLYKRKKDTERTNYCYLKAYKLIKRNENWNFDIDWLVNKTISHFKNKFDFKKATVIFLFQVNWFKISNHLVHRITLLIHQWKIFSALSLIYVANWCLSEVESLLDLETVLFLPNKKLNSGYIEIFLRFASINIYSKRDFIKAENICKAIEAALDIKLPINAWFYWKLFRNLLELYICQGKWIEAAQYIKKILKLLKLSFWKEYYRYNIRLSKSEIKKKTKEFKRIAEVINKNIAESIK